MDQGEDRLVLRETRVPGVPMTQSIADGIALCGRSWLQGSEAWGRPVDILLMPDGALLVSDDRAGAIYRISYHK